MKEWTCICGSKSFTLTKLESCMIDFGTEGAVQGYPCITNRKVNKSSLVCTGCSTKIPDAVADKMIKEIA